MKAKTASPPRGDTEAHAPPWPLLLDQQQAWRFLGLSRSGWYRLRSADQLPRPVNVPGAGLRWRREDLERWASKLRPAR